MRTVKIKAKYGLENITIIAFVNTFDSTIKAVYVNEKGELGSCFIDSNSLTITDKDYIPQSS